MLPASSRKRHRQGSWEALALLAGSHLHILLLKEKVSSGKTSSAIKQYPFKAVASHQILVQEILTS